VQDACLAAAKIRKESSELRIAVLEALAQDQGADAFWPPILCALMLTRSTPKLVDVEGHFHERLNRVDVDESVGLL